MKFVRWIVIPWIVNSGAINAIMVSELKQSEDRVQHTEWKDG
jgi:hypothetical protein